MYSNDGFDLLFSFFFTDDGHLKNTSFANFENQSHLQYNSEMDTTTYLMD